MKKNKILISYRPKNVRYEFETVLPLHEEGSMLFGPNLVLHKGDAAGNVIFVRIVASGGLFRQTFVSNELNSLFLTFVAFEKSKKIIFSESDVCVEFLTFGSYSEAYDYAKMVDEDDFKDYVSQDIARFFREEKSLKKVFKELYPERVYESEMEKLLRIGIEGIEESQKKEDVVTVSYFSLENNENPEVILYENAEELKRKFRCPREENVIFLLAVESNEDDNDLIFIDSDPDRVYSFLYNIDSESFYPNSVHLQEYDSFEDAFRVAAYMRENHKLCYSSLSNV